MMLDYKGGMVGGGGGVKFGKSDKVVCKHFQTQNHIFLEFQRIKTFQTLHQGVKILASPSKVFPT